jgi:hypothetical protein
VTASRGLALCNLLSHWLLQEGSDWVFQLLIPEAYPGQEVGPGTLLFLAVVVLLKKVAVLQVLSLCSVLVYLAG